MPSVELPSCLMGTYAEALRASTAAARRVWRGDLPLPVDVVRDRDVIVGSRPGGWAAPAVHPSALETALVDLADERDDPAGLTRAVQGMASDPVALVVMLMWSRAMFSGLSWDARVDVAWERKRRWDALHTAHATRGPGVSDLLHRLEARLAPPGPLEDRPCMLRWLSTERWGWDARGCWQGRPTRGKPLVGRWP